MEQSQRDSLYRNFLVKKVIIEILKKTSDRPIIILLDYDSDVGRSSWKDKIKFCNFQ